MNKVIRHFSNIIPIILYLHVPKVVLKQSKCTTKYGLYAQIVDSNMSTQSLHADLDRGRRFIVITCKRLLLSSDAQKLFINQPMHILGVLVYKFHTIYPGENLLFYLYKQKFYLHKYGSVLQIFTMKLTLKSQYWYQLVRWLTLPVESFLTRKYLQKTKQSRWLSILFTCS